MKTSIKAIGLLVALAVCLASPLYSQVPDLTKDAQSVDRKLTYNMGAIGLRGWIYINSANNLDAAQGRTTVASRRILVTHVGAASPTDGVVMVDDVILGVDGKPFSENRTGEIMKMITAYGSAAKPQIPALRQLIGNFNADVERRDYPGGELNNRRVNAVEEASRPSKPPRIIRRSAASRRHPGDKFKQNFASQIIPNEKKSSGDERSLT